MYIHEAAGSAICKINERSIVFVAIAIFLPSSLASIAFHNGKRNRLIARRAERHSSTQS
jgi:hypothetical protein